MTNTEPQQQPAGHDERSQYGRQRALKPTPAFTHPQHGEQPGDAFRALVLDCITRDALDDEGNVRMGQYGAFKEHVLTLVISNGTATIAAHDENGDRVKDVNPQTGDESGAVERVRIDPQQPRVVRWWVSGSTAGKVGKLKLNGGDVITVVRDANDPPRKAGENGRHNYRIEVNRRGCAVGPWEQIALAQALPALEAEGDDGDELGIQIDDPFGAGGQYSGADAGDPFGGGAPDAFAGLDGGPVTQPAPAPAAQQPAPAPQPAPMQQPVAPQPAPAQQPAPMPQPALEEEPF